MTVLRINTDSIRNGASQMMAKATAISEEDAALTAKVNQLVATGFKSNDGSALAEAVQQLGASLGRLTAVLNQLSSNMKVAAGNYDGTESGNASGFQLR